MKKNITINLFGELYAIDEDAYTLLDNYLDSMKRYFSRQEGGSEIADDIEHRVAELLWERRKGGMNAVNIETVRDIIATIGNPKDIGGDSYSKEERGYASDESWTDKAKDMGRRAEQAFSDATDDVKRRTQGRKLYRDPEQRMIGGVCAGLATYFGDMDVVLMRILVLVSIFTPIPTLLVYIVLWIVVPEARTTEDRLRMKGIAVTPDNINDELLWQGSQAKEAAGKTGRKGCFWAILIVMALPIIFVALIYLKVFFSFFHMSPNFLF